MSKHCDCMIDIETLGRDEKATVVSIGACFFNIDTGEIIDTFYKKVNWTRETDQPDRTICKDTVQWWMEQSKETQKELLSDGHDIFYVMNNFTEFVKKNTGHDFDKVRVWAKGPDFDIKILGDVYKSDPTMELPWRFWNVRCVRTMFDLGSKLGVKYPDDFKPEIAHNALDDAVSQAKKVSFVWSKIN